MSVKSTSTNPNTVGSGAPVVMNLKTLKAPEERGTKMEYEIVLEKIQNHVTIRWNFGKYIGHLLKHMEDPKTPEPTNMTLAEEAVKWKVRLWSQEVDRYRERHAALEEKKGALYAVLMDRVSKIIKQKMKIKTGYTQEDEVNDYVWLIETLEYIMIKYEDVKPKTQAINDQM